MALICICLGIALIITLFLYIQLRLEIKTLHKESQYTLAENSTFKIYTTSSNKQMKAIISDVNHIRDMMQEEKNIHLQHEKEIRDMITNISHDIRTPLTSIQGYIEMMQSSNDLMERERYYQIVSERLHDLERMLDEFFLYTKLINTNHSLVLEEKEVYPIISSALLSYMDVLQSHELLPIILCENEAVKAMIHEESFKRICTNLIINTTRYGKNPFQIKIEEHEDCVHIIFANRVKDTAVDVEHLFERFYKGNEARTQKGSGLGLAIVKELCAQMNGQVQAQMIDKMLYIIVVIQKK